MHIDIAKKLYKIAMNLKYIAYWICGLFLSYFFISCNSDSTYTYESTGKDPQIYSFSITGVAYESGDSIADVRDKERFVIVNATKFAIDQVRGIVYNPDSMPYGTVLRKKVLPNVTFNPTYGAGLVEVTIPDSISGFNWTTTDSVDFSKQPISFKVSSPDGSNSKIYDIDIRIHQVDPDTILWQQMPSYPVAIGNSKTLLLDNKFYTYSIQNNNISLYTTGLNSISWNSETLYGMNSDILPESIFLMNSVFFAIDKNGKSYKSTDGKTWITVENGKNVVSVLGVIPGVVRADDVLLLTIEDSGKYYFGKTKDMVTVEMVTNLNGSTVGYELPSSDFPLHKAASLPSYSTDKNYRMLILSGGLDSAGQEVSNTWVIRNVSEGLEISPFIRNILYKGSGVSNFFYDDKIYVLAENQFYISKTWGDIWYAAPNKQMLDPEMTERTGQTVIVDSNNNIWIFGGMSESGSYLNDVWKGCLNRLIP